MKTCRILGTGSAFPNQVITNHDLEKKMDTNHEWIVERTGICQRYVSKGETVASLGGEAVLKALECAKVSPDQVELIIVATCSPEKMIPSAACQVQSLSGCDNAVAFDLNAACGGFLFGLHTAYAYIQSGLYKNAVIVGSEVLSKLVDWEDRTTAILFGDGAGAVYVEAADQGLVTFTQHAMGKKGDALTCDTTKLVNLTYGAEEFDGKIRMDGREIFQFAVRQVPKSIEETLAKTDLSKEDIDFFVLHQANQRMLEAIAKRLGVSMDKVPTNVAQVGNMSSATIPVLLDQLNREGKLKQGMKLVLSGFGAGLTYGSTIITW